MTHLPAVRVAAILLLAPLLFVASGCSAAKGETSADKRQYAQKMRDQVLNELYRREPAAKQNVENAVGHGVFTNIGSKIFIVATGNGFGIVRDNATGEDTYMKMNELGGGLGWGVKKYRAVFVFHDEKAMREFVEDGWEVAGDVDAGAKTGDTGGAVGGKATSGQIEGLQVYVFTETGVSLSATATAALYYPDKKLNE